MPDTDLFDLTSRIAIITGTSKGGLGEWAAKALASRGATVVLSDVESNLGDLTLVRDEIIAAGGAASVAIADVRSESDVDSLIEGAVDAHGRVHILANFAGAMIRKDSLELTLEEWQRVIDVNLTGTFLLNRAAARHMVTQESGTIINTSTVYTNIVGPYPEAAYYGSKAGVANVTRGLANEWGTRGITVNCIAPGVFFPTRMTQPLGETPGRLDELASRTMLGRLGNPESDLAGTVIWLASDASRYVTGQTIFLDGGWSAK